MSFCRSSKAGRRCSPGLADSTLSRDDGYRFMVLGRAIERVDMTVRLLLSRVGDSASSPAWVTRAALGGRARHLSAHLPRCAGRQPGGRIHAAGPALPAVGLLLAAVGRAQPRRTAAAAAAAGVGATAEAQRLLGRARSELEFVRPGVLLESLEKRLAGLQKTCCRRRRSVGAAVLSLCAVGGVVGRRPARSVWSSKKGKI